MKKLIALISFVFIATVAIAKDQILAKTRFKPERHTARIAF